MQLNTVFPIAALASVALLAGCASQVIPPAQRLHGELAPRAGKAYAIVALTSDSQRGHRTLFATFSRIAPAERLALTPAQRIQSRPDMERIGGAEQGMPGALHLLELEPGEYEFTEAGSHWPDPAGREPYGEQIRLPLKHRFSLQTGESVYLGELRLTLDAPPSATVVDAHQRDFRHVTEQWQVNSVAPVIIRLMETAR